MPTTGKKFHVSSKFSSTTSLRESCNNEPKRLENSYPTLALCSSLGSAGRGVHPSLGKEAGIVLSNGHRDSSLASLLVYTLLTNHLFYTIRAPPTPPRPQHPARTLQTLFDDVHPTSCVLLRPYENPYSTPCYKVSSLWYLPSPFLPLNICRCKISAVTPASWR